MTHQTPSPKPLRPMLLVCFLGGAGLVLSGCTSGTAPQATVTVTAAPGGSTTPSQGATPTGQASQSPGATPETEPTADPQTSLAWLVAAGKSALAKVPGNVTDIESEFPGRTWEVTVFSADGAEYEVGVSADGSEVISGPRRQQTNPVEAGRYRALLDSAKLDFAQASDVVHKEAPQGIIRELGLDSWRGTTTWEAEIRDGSQTREIYVDAATGTIIKNEIDD